PENLNRNSFNYSAVARLRDDVPLARAQADLNTLAAQLADAWPRDNRGKTFVVTPLREQMAGPVRTTLYVLLGAVSLVLLIACANVSNLLLARATVRSREIAVRAALGAGRARIIRQFTIESGALALAGCALGLLLAVAGTWALVRMAPADL